MSAEAATPQEHAVLKRMDDTPSTTTAEEVDTHHDDDVGLANDDDVDDDDTARIAAARLKLQSFVRGSLTRARVSIMVGQLIDDLLARQQKHRPQQDQQEDEQEIERPYDDHKTEKEAQPESTVVVDSTGGSETPKTVQADEECEISPAGENEEDKEQAGEEAAEDGQKDVPSATPVVVAEAVAPHLKSEEEKKDDGSSMPSSVSAMHATPVSHSSTTTAPPPTIGPKKSTYNPALQPKQFVPLNKPAEWPPKDQVKIPAVSYASQSKPVTHTTASSVKPIAPTTKTSSVAPSPLTAHSQPSVSSSTASKSTGFSSVPTGHDSTVGRNSSRNLVAGGATTKPTVPAKPKQSGGVGGGPKRESLRDRMKRYQAADKTPQGQMQVSTPKYYGSTYTSTGSSSRNVTSSGAAATQSAAPTPPPPPPPVQPKPAPTPAEVVASAPSLASRSQAFGGVSSSASASSSKMAISKKEPSPSSSTPSVLPSKASFPKKVTSANTTPLSTQSNKEMYQARNQPAKSDVVAPASASSLPKVDKTAEVSTSVGPEIEKSSISNRTKDYFKAAMPKSVAKTVTTVKEDGMNPPSGNDSQKVSDSNAKCVFKRYPNATGSPKKESKPAASPAAFRGSTHSSHSVLDRYPVSPKKESKPAASPATFTGSTNSSHSVLERYPVSPKKENKPAASAAAFTGSTNSSHSVLDRYPAAKKPATPAATASSTSTPSQSKPCPPSSSSLHTSKGSVTTRYPAGTASKFPAADGSAKSVSKSAETSTHQSHNKPAPSVMNRYSPAVTTSKRPSLSEAKESSTAGSTSKRSVMDRYPVSSTSTVAPKGTNSTSFRGMQGSSMMPRPTQAAPVSSLNKHKPASGATDSCTSTVVHSSTVQPQDETVSNDAAWQAQLAELGLLAESTESETAPEVGESSN